ncbi:hypothetical protein FRC09_007177 [Ceratobasidium sp. 395]|nr:hypothetical protein FRC09_007177 [Ceratobasidium sp. 395]
MANHVATAANDLVNLWQTKQEIAKEKAFDAKIDLKLAMMGESPWAHRLDAFKPLLAHYQITMLLSRSWHASSRLVRSFMAQRVEERRREQDLREPLELATDADCILDMILQQEKLQGKKGLDENEILDELLLLFLGGHDSTSATLFWLVKYMALDAEIQRRLHGEVGDVFGHDLEDTSSIVLSVLEDSDRIPILEAVVAETLRCAMTTGAIGRYLTSDEVIMGRHVPKDNQIPRRNRISDTRLTHGHE